MQISSGGKSGSYIAYFFIKSKQMGGGDMQLESKELEGTRMKER
jgi:hypothetical protein